MLLYPKGLEAARELSGTNHGAIIRAYLSTVTPAEVGGLVAALRAVDHGSVEDCFLQSPLFEKAATALEAHAAELAGANADRDRWYESSFRSTRRAERAEAALAEARKALDRIERKICAAEHAHTINDVLANYREVRRTVQDARAARHELTGGQEE